MVCRLLVAVLRQLAEFLLVTAVQTVWSGGKKKKKIDIFQKLVCPSSVIILILNLAHFVA